MKNYLILTMLKSKKVVHVSEMFWALVGLTGAQGLADSGKK
jgi:hypothetical protein